MIIQSASVVNIEVTFLHNAYSYGGECGLVLKVLLLLVQNM